MNAESDHGDIPDLNGMSTAQRAVIALDLLPALLKNVKHGRKPENRTRKASEEAAKILGVGRTSIETVLAIHKRDWDQSIIDRMRAGELNIAQAARAAGVGKRSDQMAGGSKQHDALGRSQPQIFYGKGDKWKEAVTPLLRYLSAWERKEYKYRHVAPREARRRLALIAELQEKLNAAKTDLEQRAHSATLTIRQKG